jgi:hypothetical protein
MSCCLANAQTAPSGGTSSSSGTTPAFRPLTQSQRFHDYLKSTISLEELLRTAAGAGIEQSLNTPHEWGQGAGAYGVRLANVFGQDLLRQTLMYGSADLLHEDNRYLPMEEGGASARFKYAVESTFLARKADGSRRLSYSRLGSYLAIAFVSREWQPRSTRGPGSAMASFGTTLSAEAGFNVAREFLPKLFGRH